MHRFFVPRAAHLPPLAVVVAVWLVPQAAKSQSAPTPYSPPPATSSADSWSSSSSYGAPPSHASPSAGGRGWSLIEPESPAYRAFGAAVLGIDFGASVWLAAGASSSDDLKSGMLKPLPVVLALATLAAGATSGALLITDDRRFGRLGIPIAIGVLTGTLFAVFGGGGWFLSCNEPAGPDRDACHQRAGRFFAGSLSIGTFLGGATGLALALTVPSRSESDGASASVLVGPGSLLVRF